MLICFLGFYLGGGELFPIHFSNMLVRHGLNVSVLIFSDHEELSSLRLKLDRRIAIYNADGSFFEDPEQFCLSLGVDLIHSHNICAEFGFFSKTGLKMSFPYVVTLHGSYQFADIDDGTMFRIIRGVDRWVYLTEKNIAQFAELPLDRSIFRKIPNAVAMETGLARLQRSDFAINDNAFVFCLMSRAIREKGWEQAINAFQSLLLNCRRDIHLLLCGSGPEAERLASVVDDPRVHFLGFRENPHAVYCLSDCALLPSRFGGESYPLALVEALQCGIPVICTDIGECRDMVTSKGSLAGIVIEPRPDDFHFERELTQAMAALLDDHVYEHSKEVAQGLRDRFEPARMLSEYLKIYADLTGPIQLT